MITEFILWLIETAFTWVVSWLPEVNMSGVSSFISDAAGAMSSLSTVLGALDKWFAVGPLLVIVAISVGVQLVVTAYHLYLRIKQAIPFVG